MITLLLLALALPVHTPGVLRPINGGQVCGTKWGQDRRHVTPRMKREVARRYGIRLEDLKHYEVDHLIPRSLGGADDVDNLWPQPWPEAHKKDKREVEVHRAVCNGEMRLKDAQDEMRHWGRK